VVPAPLEETLQLSPYILQVFIDGTNKPFNVALVVPDHQKIEAWGKDNGTDDEFPELVKRPEVESILRKEIDKFSNDFKGYERVKKFALISEEFTTENGMLTPTLKLKRRKVLEKYGSLLESLWK
jgi:long-chain acyl-CoA synthetase